MMNIVIRLASLDDVRGIVEVHCSSIDKWVKRINGEEVEARYEELNVEERFRHGGPWVSVETCAIHINYLLAYGQYPLIAELNGKIIGELELYIGEERNILGKCAYIDVLEVHRNYRRRGIGRALVNKAIEIARKHSCDTIAVWPTKEAIEFYRKCGIRETAYNIVYLEIDLRKTKPKERNTYEIKTFPNEYNILKDMELISPRIFSSFAAWLKSRWRYAIEEARTVGAEGYIPELQAVYIIESQWFNTDVARLSLWISSKEKIPFIMNVIFKIAKNMGFNKLHLLIDESIYQDLMKDYSHKIIDHELLLISKLK